MDADPAIQAGSAEVPSRRSPPRRHSAVTVCYSTALPKTTRPYWVSGRGTLSMKDRH